MIFFREVSGKEISKKDDETFSLRLEALFIQHCYGFDIENDVTFLCYCFSTNGNAFTPIRHF